MKDLNCTFCKIIAEEEPAVIIERSEYHVAFKPLREHVPGHVLFVPVQHVEDAAKNPTAAAGTMLNAARYVHSLGTPANIITSIGAAATQTEFHLHIHVLPRGEDDGLRASWPWRIKPGEQLGQNEIDVSARRAQQERQRPQQ